MDGFFSRLQSFYDQGNKGGAWTLKRPSPEDMAGAGFRLQGESSPGDVAVCDICQVMGWKWDAKDDPFEEHIKNGADCAYVQSPLFAKCKDMFTKKSTVASTPPATPDVGGVAKNSSAATPRRKRVKLVLSDIHTVASVEPRAAQHLKSKPMEITVRGPGVRLLVEVNGDDGDAAAEQGAFLFPTREDAVLDDNHTDGFSWCTSFETTSSRLTQHAVKKKKKWHDAACSLLGMSPNNRMSAIAWPWVSVLYLSTAWERDG